MKAIAIFLLFIGAILIVQGYYDKKLTCGKEKIIVKYIPRSTYEEQMNLLAPAQSAVHLCGPDDRR